jgi:TetR/AcrR family transcriptional regulator, mexJK operon transcriptional repressor
MNVGHMLGMTPSTPKHDTETVPPTKARILQAARTLFFERGFSAVSTDTLSRGAGVSKASIYKYFGDMHGVLAAVVSQEGDSLSVDVVPIADTRDEFWQALTTYGTNLLILLNQDFCIQMDRMLHEEARKHPELIRIFYDAAYGRGHREVTKLIEHGQRKGFIRKPQAADALADNLASMWNGLAFTRTRLGLMDRPYENPAAWAQHCVDTLFADDVDRPD